MKNKHILSVNGKSLLLYPKNPLISSPIDITVLLEFLENKERKKDFYPLFTCSCGIFDCGGMYTKLNIKRKDSEEFLVIENLYGLNNKLLEKLNYECKLEGRNSSDSIRQVLIHYLESRFMQEGVGYLDKSPYSSVLNSLRIAPLNEFLKKYKELQEIENDVLANKKKDNRSLLSRLISKIQLRYLLLRVRIFGIAENDFGMGDLILERSGKTKQEWAEFFDQNGDIDNIMGIQNFLSKYDINYFAVLEIVGEMKKDIEQ